MRFFKLFSPSCGAWACALVLSFFVPMTIAQSALPTVQSTLQAPLSTSGKSVSGRVSEPLTDSVPSAAPIAATPAPPTTQPTTETLSAPVPTSAASEVSEPTDWNRLLEAAQPMINNPLIGVGALLALMLFLAALMYRRNKRKDALALSSAQRLNEEPEVNLDTLQPTRGLQAEIMALDLELGPSVAPAQASAQAFSAPQQSIAAKPSGEDLRLCKLQWAQQLLAAGENELALVLLTSVTESLKRPVLQPGDANSGPRQ